VISRARIQGFRVFLLNTDSVNTSKIRKVGQKPRKSWPETQEKLARNPGKVARNPGNHEISAQKKSRVVRSKILEKSARNREKLGKVGQKVARKVQKKPKKTQKHCIV
jgi:hypothetical protein